MRPPGRLSNAASAYIAGHRVVYLRGWTHTELFETIQNPPTFVSVRSQRLSKAKLARGSIDGNHVGKCAADIDTNHSGHRISELNVYVEKAERTIDGVGFAREIRSRYPNLPVALTTGYSDAATEAPSNLRILRKPFDTEALRDFIHDITPPGLLKPSRVPLASSTAGALRRS
jgi:hypothetical protein